MCGKPLAYYLRAFSELPHVLGDEELPGALDCESGPPWNHPVLDDIEKILKSVRV